MLFVNFSLRNPTFFLLIVSLLAARPCEAATSFAAGVATGTIQNAAMNEISGIAASRRNANVLWAHNDSGDSARVFAMTTAGATLGTYSITGASALDWEDIAVGPGPVLGTQYLYLGDIGDNFAIRIGGISVYRVAEPVVSDTQSPVMTSLSGTEKMTFVYPDGPRDTESMFVDPQTRDIYFISKRENPHRVYRAAYPQATSGTTTLEYVTQFNHPNWLTAGDINVSGNEIIVRGTESSSGRLFVRPTDGSIADAFNSTPFTIPLRSETQGEAIGFDPRGWGYYTTSEGTNQPIYYFDRLPHGDFDHNGVVDTRDYVVWRKGLGSIYQTADFDAWRLNFGATAPGAGMSSELVPEPAWLATLLALLFLSRVRRSVGD